MCPPQNLAWARFRGAHTSAPYKSFRFAWKRGLPPQTLIQARRPRSLERSRATQATKGFRWQKSG